MTSQPTISRQHIKCILEQTVHGYFELINFIETEVAQYPNTDPFERVIQMLRDEGVHGWALLYIDPANQLKSVWTPRVTRWAVETAMRQGEILALDWKHVDFERRTAHLPETKNGTARTVPLSTAAIALIQPTGKVRLLRKGKVFPTTASAIKQSFTRAVARGRRLYLVDCEKAGIEPESGFLEDFTFHDLRHEATSRLAERLQMHELMRVTGHKDTRMLARYYHPRAEDLAKKLG